jgi:hypothetical protein
LSETYTVESLRLNMTTHSYAIRSNLGMGSSGFVSPEEGIQFGPYFRLEGVSPVRHLGAVYEKFEKESDYGKFAPFRDEIYCELVANEKDWAFLQDDQGELFSDLPAEVRLKIIQGHADAMFLLFRLCGMTQFTVPVELHGSSFKSLKQQPDKSVKAKFRFSQALIFPVIGPGVPQRLDKENIEWIMNHLLTVVQMNSSGELHFLHDLFDIINFPNPSIQLVQIWAAIESVVKSQIKKTRHSIRSRCAMLLCETVHERRQLYAHIGKLYDFRCAIVHGTEEFSIEKYLNGFQETEIVGETKLLFDSFSILKRLVVKMIEGGEIPSPEILHTLQNDYDKMK